MRLRTVVTGISAAALCVFALWLQFYKTGLNNYVPGWMPGVPPQSGVSLGSLVVLMFCVLILLAAGWVSARWNWAKTWQASIATGAGTGLLAGCLIYNFFGAFWFGVVGHAEVLANAYISVNEAQGTRIIVEALINTNRLIYLNFVWCMFASVALGILGGLASAIVDIRDCWGRSPRHPEGWLFRVPAYILVYLGIINLLVTFAVMDLLSERLMNSLAQLNEAHGIALLNDFDKANFLHLNYLVSWSFVILPTGLITGWFIRLFRHGGSLTLSSITGLVLMLVSLLTIIWFLSPAFFSSKVISLALVLALIGGVLLTAWVGLMTRDESEGFPYHTSDWFGYLLGCGILGATQITMGSVAFALPVALLNIVNIEHIVRDKPVDMAPMNQVSQYFDIQTIIGFGTIIISVVIALIIVNIVSFFRSFFDIREIYPMQTDEGH